MHHRLRDLLMRNLVAVIQALLTLHHMLTIPCNELLDRKLIWQKMYFLTTNSIFFTAITRKTRTEMFRLCIIHYFQKASPAPEIIAVNL